MNYGDKKNCPAVETAQDRATATGGGGEWRARVGLGLRISISFWTRAGLGPEHYLPWLG